MNFLRILLLLAFVFSLSSCGSDDDICLGGEATPRLKIKFKTQDTGKPRILDSLFIDVAYADGLKNVVNGQINVDSVMVPLRVDESTETDIFVRLRKHGNASQVRINYTTKAAYVSPACGIKKVYEEVSYSLLQPTPVTSVETVQTAITDEQKTHLYLLF